MSLCDYWGPHLERCGFVLKDGTVVEVTNSHPNNQDGFRIDSIDTLRLEDQIAATWHTHPKTGVNLSMEDYHCFLNWPQWEHFIVSESSVALYYVENNRVLRHDSDPSRLPATSDPLGSA